MIPCVRIFFMDGIYRINPIVAPKATKRVIFLDQNVSLQELGAKVLGELYRKQEDVPIPRNSAERAASLKEWYKAMKIKSWKYVLQNAKSTTVLIFEGQIKLSSSKPDSVGFGPSGKPPRFCPLDDPLALGQAIIDTIADCQPADPPKPKKPKKQAEQPEKL